MQMKAVGNYSIIYFYISILVLGKKFVIVGAGPCFNKVKRIVTINILRPYSFLGLHLKQVRSLRDEAPSNLATLCYKAVEKLATAADTLLQVDSSREQQIGTCLTH